MEKETRVFGGPCVRRKELAALLAQDARERRLVQQGREVALYDMMQLGSLARNPGQFDNSLVMSRASADSRRKGLTRNEGQVWQKLCARSHVTGEGLEQLGVTVMFAGGAVVDAVWDLAHSKDVDVFFISPTLDTGKATQAAALLLDAIQATATNVEIFRSRNCTTVALEQDVTVQFVHRLYPSAASVLCGFDLGSCAIGALLERGRPRVLMSSLGLFCQVQRCNVVDSTRRSPSYEQRLWKYYCRGFSIVFPQVAGTLLHQGRMLQLTPHAVLIGAAQPQKAHLRVGAEQVDGSLLDYSHALVWGWRNFSHLNWLMLKRERQDLLLAFLSKDRCKELGASAVLQPHVGKLFKRGALRRMLQVLPVRRASETLLDVYRRHYGEDVGPEVAKCHARGDVAGVQRLLRECEEEIVARLTIAKEELFGNGVEWLTKNVSGQHTSSFRPIDEPPAAYFGEYHQALRLQLLSDELWVTLRQLKHSSQLWRPLPIELLAQIGRETELLNWRIALEKVAKFPSKPDYEDARFACRRTFFSGLFGMGPGFGPSEHVARREFEAALGAVQGPKFECDAALSELLSCIPHDEFGLFETIERQVARNAATAGQHLAAAAAVHWPVDQLLLAGQVAGRPLARQSVCLGDGLPQSLDEYCSLCEPAAPAVLNTGLVASAGAVLVSSEVMVTAGERTLQVWRAENLVCAVELADCEQPVVAMAAMSSHGGRSFAVATLHADGRTVRLHSLPVVTARNLLLRQLRCTAEHVLSEPAVGLQGLSVERGLEVTMQKSQAQFLSVPELKPMVPREEQRALPAGTVLLDHVPLVFARRLLRQEEPGGGMVLESASEDGQVLSVSPEWRDVRLARVHPMHPVALCVTRDESVRLFSLLDLSKSVFVCCLLRMGSYFIFHDRDSWATTSQAEPVAGVAWSPDDSVGCCVAWGNGMVRLSNLQPQWQQILAASTTIDIGVQLSATLPSAPDSVMMMDVTEEDVSRDHGGWFPEPKSSVAQTDATASFAQYFKFAPEAQQLPSGEPVGVFDMTALPSGWGDGGAPSSPERLGRLTIYPSEVEARSAFGWDGGQDKNLVGGKAVAWRSGEFGYEAPGIPEDSVEVTNWNAPFKGQTNGNPFQGSPKKQ